MISTISERETSSSRTSLEYGRSWTALWVIRLSGALIFAPHGGHIRTALRLGLMMAMTLPIVLDAGPHRWFGDGFTDEGVDVGAAQLGRQIALQQGDLRRLFIDQILAIGPLGTSPATPCAA